MGEVENYIESLENQLREERSKSAVLNQHAASQIFDNEENENLIKFQLDIKEELGRIERLLRKQVPKRDKNGHEYWEDCKENQVFNESGINEILNLLAWYLNKNIILSYYEDEEINIRMKQLHKRLTDFIFVNAHKFGMDTREKIRHYPMIVTNIINTIEAAYMRARSGGERESLRTARTVTQSDAIGMRQNHPSIKPKSFSILKPSTWIPNS